MRTAKRRAVVLAILLETALTGAAAAQGHVRRMLTVEDGLVHSHVLSIGEDRDGFLWFGTADGASRFDGLAFVNFRSGDGLPEGLVEAIYQAPEGPLYFGTTGGAAIYEQGRMRPLADRRLSRIAVRAITGGPGGAIYFGTPQGVVARRLDGRSELLPPGGASRNIVALLARPLAELSPFLSIIQNNGQAWNRVEAVHQTRDGTVYFGTDQGVGIYYPRTAIESWTWRTGLPKGAVQSITEDGRGTISVETPEGRVRFEDGGWKAEAATAGLPGDLFLGAGQEPTLHRTGRLGNRVYSRHQGQDGTLYVGTPQGLAMFHPGRTRRDELTEDSVYCILDDGAGRLYLSTKRGIKVIDPAASPVAVQTTWAPADGLAGEIGVPGACHRDRAGHLWFGFYSGVSVIDPTVQKPRREPPRARISGVELAGRPIIPPPSGRRLVLAGHQKDLTVSFLAVELNEPHRVRYRYRLAEADSSWSETSTRAVHFSDPAPGDHTFEVAAAVRDGPWGEAARLGWHVPTPFYRSWWFFLLTLLAAMAVAAAVATWRARYLLALERLRTAIAADLHDRIGSGLTEIAFLAETGERSRVAGIARELTGQLGDVVWLIHPRRDSLDQLFLRLKDTYAELFAQEKAVFRTVDLSVFERVRLPVTCRQNLYLLFKEAFHNALRHAGCREIALDVALEGRQLEVTLTDDGRGFDPEAVDDEGDGLVNMQRRAAAIGGRLAIESAPGHGTVVRYTGPLR